MTFPKTAVEIGAGRWRGLTVGDGLGRAGRWLLLAAVCAAAVTPRMSFGSIHVGLGDLLGLAGSACWVGVWIQARSESARMDTAKWPLLALVAGGLSLFASLDLRGSFLGMIELGATWVLPTLAVAGLFRTDDTRTRLLTAVSAGTLAAAAANVLGAMRIGLSGGLPQVWGAADGFQGYFQVLGLSVAVPSLVNAYHERKATGTCLWSVAIALHATALLLTQTRGAWLAAVVGAVSMGFVSRRAMAATVGVLGAIGLMVVLGTDWGLVVRERMLSVFRPEANLSGFDSSVIRIGLALTALNMFIQHPLTGIGLKCFPLALPYYAPSGLPLAVEMGPDQVLTPVLGPHSTYLSLLCEAGVLGGVAIVGWVVSAWWNVRHNVGLAGSAERRRLFAPLAGMIPAIAVFNLFGEMNASGALPVVVCLALASTIEARVAPEPGR